MEDYFDPIGPESDPQMELLGRWKEFVSVQLPPAGPTTGRRGRPRRLAVASISDISPRQLARNDLIEVAQNWEAVVQLQRAESLNDARPTRAIRARESLPSQERARRIQAIAAMLRGPTRTAWQGWSAARIGGQIAASFPDVKPETLRKDIAKAKKLARST